MMKKTLLSVALTLAAIGSAQAQQSANPLRFVVGAGLTFGGDTLATVNFSNGTSQSIKGGGLVHLYVGGEYRFSPEFSVQTNVGYHADNTSASNGDLKFERYPIEVLGHYFINDQFRLGGGARFVSGATLDGSGAASGVHVDFKSTTGLVLEGEYLFSRNVGVKLRFVNEDYKPKNGGSSVSGNHAGVYVTGYF